MQVGYGFIMAFVLYRDYALMQRDTVWVTVKVIMTDFYPNLRARSEERRVGKECRL